MTVSESLITWLKSNTSLSVIEEIETDILRAQSESMGVYKQSNNETLDYIDGSKLVKEYYIVLVKQYNQLENDRISNQQFLYDLECWVETSNLDGVLPTLEDNATCQSVKISNTYYMQEETETQSIYQLSVEIVYLKN